MSICWEKKNLTALRLQSEPLKNLKIIVSKILRNFKLVLWFFVGLT